MLAVSDVHPVVDLRAEPSVSPTAATRLSRRQVRGALPRRQRPSRPAGPCITRYISIAGTPTPTPASILCALVTILDCSAYQNISVSRTTASDYAASKSRSPPRGSAGECPGANALFLAAMPAPAGSGDKGAGHGVHVPVKKPAGVKELDNQYPDPERSSPLAAAPARTRLRAADPALAAPQPRERGQRPPLVRLGARRHRPRGDLPAHPPVGSQAR
jgi:hypothetical protein